MKFIVSITTTPERIGYLVSDTIPQLLKAHELIDKILVFMPTIYRGFTNDNHMNNAIESLEKVILVKDAVDYGPSTKLLAVCPHLEPGQWVFFCDDDQMYVTAYRFLYSMKLSIEKHRGDGNIILQNGAKEEEHSGLGGSIAGYKGFAMNYDTLRKLQIFPKHPSMYCAMDQWIQLFALFHKIEIVDTSFTNQLLFGTHARPRRSCDQSIKFPKGIAIKKMLLDFQSMISIADGVLSVQSWNISKCKSAAQMVNKFTIVSLLPYNSTFETWDMNQVFIDWFVPFMTISECVNDSPFIVVVNKSDPKQVEMITQFCKYRQLCTMVPFHGKHYLESVRFAVKDNTLLRKQLSVNVWDIHETLAKKEIVFKSLNTSILL